MKRRRPIGLYMLMALGLAVVLFLVFRPHSDQSSSGNRLRVTAESARVAQIKPDGMPDYLTELNKHLGAGVTPGSNAEAALRAVLGPSGIPSHIRSRYYQLLGLPMPLDENGDYFIGFSDYLRSAEVGLERGPVYAEAIAGLSTASTAPWDEQKYPLVAQWLAKNEKYLDAIVQATTRSDMYVPLVDTSQGKGLAVIGLLLPACQQHRELAKSLTCRAMLRLEHGDVTGAWNDLLACHRLARHVSRGAMLIEALVGIGIESSTCAADRVLASTSALSPEMARSMEEDLRALAPMPTLAQHIDRGERFLFLDSALTMAKHGSSVLRQMSVLEGRQSNNGVERLAEKLVSSMVDWNEVLRIGNRFYDRMAEAARAKRPEQRERVTRAIEEDLEKMAIPHNPLELLAGSKKQRGRAMAGMLMRLSFPPGAAMLRSRDVAFTEFELTRLELLLLAYQAEHGQFPSDLNALVPEYCKAVATDPITGAPFIYHSEGTTALLYSVGRNGKDDGGQKSEDDTRLDDIVVRLEKRDSSS